MSRDMRVEIDDWTIPVSALPIRAYNLIWNEYYREQELRERYDALREELDKLES